MGRRIRLFNGDQVSNNRMDSVQQTKRGVACLDAQGKLVTWIKVTDPVKARKVLDIMSDFVDAGDSAQQPDWSFLAD